VKLNTHNFFGTAHHYASVCTEYQLFHDMLCNILGIIIVNNKAGRISIITFVWGTKRNRKQTAW